VVAHEQFKLPFKATASKQRAAKPAPATLKETKTTATVTGVNGFSLTIDKRKGSIASISASGRVVLTEGPRFNLWRGPLDNDGVKGWTNAWDTPGRALGRWGMAGLNNLTHKLLSCELGERRGVVTVTSEHRYTGKGNNLGVTHLESYKIYGNGEIKANNTFEVDAGLEDIPRLGVRMTAVKGLEGLTWYGLGPNETYSDRKAGAVVGTFSGTVREQYYPYILPQENGNKEEVRWFSLGDKKGTGLKVTAGGAMNFSAHHFTPEDLTKAYHTNEVEERDEVTILMDCIQRGLGTGSCGPDTLDTYKLKSGTHRFRYTLEVSG